MASAARCGLMISKHQRILTHLLPILSIGNSRNFCSSSLQSNESSILGNNEENELDMGTIKQTEIYNKNKQYKEILSRVNGTKVYSRSNETRQVEQCQNVDELKALYRQMHGESDSYLLPKFDIYNAFLRKAMGIDQIYHNELIDKLKEKLLDKDLEYPYKEVAIGKLINNEMTAVLQNAKTTKQGVSGMFQVWEEFKNLCNDESNTWNPDLPYYPLVLSRLLSACIMANSFTQCQPLIDGIFNEWPTFDYNKNQQIKLWNTIMNYYAKTKDLDGMENVYKKMTEEYKIKPDDVTFNIRCRAFAKQNDPRFEALFVEYLKIFNRYPNEDVFNALLNGYAFNGDIESCISVLKLLLTKNDENSTDPMVKTLPNLNIVIFMPIIKALMNTESLIKAEYGWQLVDYILTEMGKANIEPNEIIYGMIFCLCGNDNFDEPSMEKLRFYYEEMTEKYELKPQIPQLKSLLRAGLQFYDFINKDQESQEEKINITKEKYAFVGWWKQEMDKYNVAINNDLKRILIDASCIGCI